MNFYDLCWTTFNFEFLIETLTSYYCAIFGERVSLLLTMVCDSTSYTSYIYTYKYMYVCIWCPIYIYEHTLQLNYNTILYSSLSWFRIVSWIMHIQILWNLYLSLPLAILYSAYRVSQAQTKAHNGYKTQRVIHHFQWIVTGKWTSVTISRRKTTRLGRHVTNFTSLTSLTMFINVWSVLISWTSKWKDNISKVIRLVSFIIVI